MRPTRRAILILASAIFVPLLPALGWPRAWPATVMLWVLSAVVGIVDAVVAPRRRELTWEVTTPRVLHIGRGDEAAVRLNLGRRRAIPVELIVDLSPGLEPQGAAAGMSLREPISFSFVLMPRRRGTVTVERLWIRWGSPLRLWTRTCVDELAREIPVLPDLQLVRRTALRFFYDRQFRAGMKIERYRGDGTEFDSLKEFLVGDDHRTMDWKASARHRKLLCRQNRAERNHQVVLAIDTGRLMSEPLGGIPKLDHALNSALVLAWICLSSGDRVGLFTFDARIGPGLAPLRGVASMPALVQASTRIEYSNTETNFTLGLTSLTQRLRRRSLIILLTDFLDTITAELLLENIDRVGKRNLLVFCSVRDPGLARTAGEEPRSPAALNRAVVARNLLRDREIVQRRLKRMGVFPLDAEPGSLTPGLINQYLEIKRREMV